MDDVGLSMFVIVIFIDGGGLVDGVLFDDFNFW